MVRTSSGLRLFHFVCNLSLFKGFSGNLRWVQVNHIPAIKPLDVEKGTLILEHDFDGRELELEFAKDAIKYIASLWGEEVKIQTKLNGQNKVLCCNQAKEITIS